MDKNQADTPDPAADERLKAADPARGIPGENSEELLQRLIARRPAKASKRPAVLSAAATAAVFTIVGVSALTFLSRGTQPAPAVTAGAADSAVVVAPELGRPNSEGAAASNASGQDAKMSVYPGWGSAPYLVPGPGLPTAPSRRVGYEVSLGNVTLVAYAEKLARELGISSGVERQPGSFLAGSPDGTSPTLWVSDDSLGSWSYSSNVAIAWDCAQPAPAPAKPAIGAEIPDAAGGQSLSSPGQGSEGCQDRKPPLPLATAEQRARDLASALGGTQDFSWESTSDGQFTTVTGSLMVEGQPTQLTWSLTFDDKALVWANGFAASPTQTTEFDVLGPAAAVARSHDTRFAALGPFALYGSEAVDGSAPAEGIAEPQENAASGNNSAAPSRIQIWWDPVVVDTAEQVLVQYWNQDGSVLLLPGYALPGGGGLTWQVIGVADKHLEFVQAERTGMVAPLAEARR